VTKALGPNPSQRYASAADFQSDLQAFLEHRPAVAELERRSNWRATATLEAARAALRKVTRAGSRVNRRLRVAGALAWFGAGMLLWIGGSYAWQAIQARASAAASLPPRPAEISNDGLPPLYVSAADKILESYRTSADPWLYDFDWQKAEILLQRAADLGAADDQTLGKLALSRGYATLERLNGAQYSDMAAAHLRLRARDQFAIAARKMPLSPDPHLALARVYVYSLPNADRAMAEFAAAERLGLVLGRRELEQQGDAYRIRAENELKADLEQALQDAKTAHALYARIPGFDQVDEHLNDLKSIHPPVIRSARQRRLRRWR
jgi:hypothetical protein